MYEVVVIGLTKLVWVVIPFDHENDPPVLEGFATKIKSCPEQIVASVTEMLGWGLTTTVRVVSLAQLPDKGVNVYVVV